LSAGEEIQLADIAGQGVIHHIWLTTTPTPAVLRGLVIRAFWDGQSEASVEAPVGDFFGSAHGKIQA
jgi:hypothetical protein